MELDLRLRLDSLEVEARLLRAVLQEPRVSPLLFRVSRFGFKVWGEGWASTPPAAQQPRVSPLLFTEVPRSSETPLP